MGVILRLANVGMKVRLHATLVQTAAVPMVNM